eukprot:TRINITY_DN3086_c0_g1_i1.p1 TRINITY_DN3086_c0_g1~~TRINITY_DN3086_c0_g1_i1.p1  ORF type:complete len:557 (-),score=140.14 TRINITY_DN3086_c0_g1_i1:164-1666(-)
MSADQAFYCTQWPLPDLESAFLNMRDETSSFVSDSLFVGLPPLDSSIPDEIHESTFSEVSADDSTDEALYLLRELEDWPYDHANAPKIGPQYQCDLQHAFEDFEDTEEDMFPGELIWDPSKTTIEKTDLYLAETQCELQHDVDVFYATPDADLSKLPNLVTLTKAMEVFHECDYDVAEATKKMKEIGVWSAKKRVFEPWNEEDVEAFEAGMRVQPKRFRYVLHEHLGGRGKTLLQVMQYYYVWKKLPRYSQWKRKRVKSYNRESGGPKLYDWQRTAPTKEGEHNFDYRHILGLRSRPRVDYSQSAQANRVRRTTVQSPSIVSESKRTYGEMMYDSAEGPAQLFDIEISGDIDIDLLRAVKKARFSLPSDPALTPLAAKSLNPSSSDAMEVDDPVNSLKAINEKLWDEVALSQKRAEKEAQEVEALRRSINPRADPLSTNTAAAPSGDYWDLSQENSTGPAPPPSSSNKGESSDPGEKPFSVTTPARPPTTPPPPLFNEEF